MSDSIQSFRDERAKGNERILSADNKAAIMKRVYGLDTFAYQNRTEGLSAKEKEILGLVTSMVLRCDDCIKYHLEKCYEHAVANDEMMDIFGIANVVGGTIVIPHTRRAIQYWEQLNASGPEPSPFSEASKSKAYDECIQMLEALLEGVENQYSKMATINEVLKSNIPYYYWVGFYLAEKDKLTVGPYQGTHGCLFIKYGEGVCGRAAQEKKSILVGDTTKLNEAQNGVKGHLHISCDPRSLSEIVSPVFDSKQQLIAVFDVDSNIKNAFDAVDKKYIELILKKFFS